MEFLRIYARHHMRGDGSRVGRKWNQHGARVAGDSPMPATATKKLTHIEIPRDQTSADLSIAGKTVTLTNLQKPFWPELGITKGDLIQYYADIASVVLPHVRDRAMVMKRYPHGAHGEFFF